MSKLAKALTAAAGNAGESLYVEDVFSTYLYDGNGTSQTITNGIDLAGEGGLTWFKARSSAVNNGLVDTERGYTSADAKILYSDLTQGNSTVTNYLEATSTGFNLLSGSGGGSLMNGSGISYASWTFRKAEKFFDVVTWTGDGTGARTISHNLNGTVGALFMKATNADMQWFSYHNGLTNAQFLELNATTSAVSSANAWNNTTPTSSEFTVGSYGNISGRTYVAYLFASDAGGFGDDGSESIIKCGSYTGNGGTQEINLGFEPQWLLIKSTTQVDSWFLTDIMRGMPNNGPTPYLLPNMSNAEAVASAGFFPQATATGFKIGASGSVNGSGQSFIYIAIRRPMKTPESGTEVFAVNDMNNSTAPYSISNFPVDLGIRRAQNFVDDNLWMSRLIQGKALISNSTAAESPDSIAQFDFQDGFLDNTSASSLYTCWMFKRATGFFDVLSYTGTSDLSTIWQQNIPHNLKVTPELIIVKRRAAGSEWFVYHAALGYNYETLLNRNNATVDRSGAALEYQLWYQAPTDTQFTVNGSSTNLINQTHIAYLFATVAGVSKVGSYTGTGSNVDVDCGFSAGARFILIKRTDSTGDWYVWDSFRGIVAGNDPYLFWNSTAAQVTSTDYIDPLASGFTVTSTAPAALNASGGTYIFLAIA